METCSAVNCDWYNINFKNLQWRNQHFAKKRAEGTGWRLLWVIFISNKQKRIGGFPCEKGRVLCPPLFDEPLTYKLIEYGLSYPCHRAYCAPLPKSLITAFLQNGLKFRVSASWLFFLVNFNSENRFHKSGLIYIAIATIQLFRINLKAWISLLFKYFHMRKTFLEMTFYSLGIIRVRSLMKAHIRSVTVEIFQKIICPNMVIGTILTH